MPAKTTPAHPSATHPVIAQRFILEPPWRVSVDGDPEGAVGTALLAQACPGRTRNPTTLQVEGCRRATQIDQCLESVAKKPSLFPFADPVGDRDRQTPGPRPGLLPSSKIGTSEG